MERLTKIIRYVTLSCLALHTFSRHGFLTTLQRQTTLEPIKTPTWKLEPEKATTSNETRTPDSIIFNEKLSLVDKLIGVAVALLILFLVGLFIILLILFMINYLKKRRQQGSTVVQIPTSGDRDDHQSSDCTLQTAVTSKISSHILDKEPRSTRASAASAPPTEITTIPKARAATNTAAKQNAKSKKRHSKLSIPKPKRTTHAAKRAAGPTTPLANKIVARKEKEKPRKEKQSKRKAKLTTERMTVPSARVTSAPRPAQPLPRTNLLNANTSTAPPGPGGWFSFKSKLTPLPATPVPAGSVITPTPVAPVLSSPPIPGNNDG